ncbi:MAG TPA: hypothetical protein VNZ26_28425, partial [Vicinamibacterales bacterium]|nr:hypothetical protein [Vicinamibacterales bacterium]
MRNFFFALVATFSLGLGPASAAQATQATRSPGQILIADVRAAIARSDFGGAQSLVDQAFSTV